jgi:hypothetical protein
MAGLSNAGTVYMTGSTAMRSIVYSTIMNPGTVFQAAPSYTVYQGGSTSNNAGNSGNFMAFSGTLVGGSGTTVIKCHWSGSEGGILDVASNTIVSETFIDDSLLDGHDHGTNVPAVTVSAYVNLAMADNSQPYSRTKKPTLTKGTEVGVITFKWIRNNGLWTGTNVTDSMIRQALGGFCKLAVFSGNTADTNSYVYVSGRDNLSGTRVNAFGDTGYGIFTVPNQIEMNSSGVMQDLTGGGVYAGDYGFSSGGSLAATMGATTTAAVDNWNGVTGYSTIAYLSVGDAATALGLSPAAVELTYDGVLFSPAAVKEGTYNFWGNEYIYEANNVLSGSEPDKVYGFLSPLATGIDSFCDGTKAIKLTDMHCSRPGPTGDPVHN